MNNRIFGTKSRQLITSGLALSLCASIFCGASGDAAPRKWTVDKRLNALSREVDEGRRANSLKTDQVEDFKHEIADLRNDIAEKQRENNGRLTIPDRKHLHGEITDLSVKIFKTRLTNVYGD